MTDDPPICRMMPMAMNVLASQSMAQVIEVIAKDFVRVLLAFMAFCFRDPSRRTLDESGLFAAYFRARWPRPHGK